MADALRRILDSESDESEFSGFELSDVDSDISIPSDFSDEDSDCEDDRQREEVWTGRFSDIRVCNLRPYF